MKLSKLSTILLTLTLSIFMATPSYAEEVAPETPTETSAPTPAETTPAYEPPAEALTGVGGWAVVDPVTGNVHGVIVCTNDVCGPSGSWGGRLPVEYMGCTNCNLRFQTRATSDGNVAGWHGTQTNVDQNGNASQTNDGSVKWNEPEKNFTIKNSSTDSSSTKITRTQTLIPEKTASYGKNLHTGIVDVNTEYESGLINNQRVKGTTSQLDLNDLSSSISLEFPNWANGKKFFFDNPNLFIDNVNATIEGALLADGFDPFPSPTTSSSGFPDEITPTPIEDSEDVVFVKAIKTLTENVKKFFSGMFGLNKVIE
jgi:hypothetical protein